MFCEPYPDLVYLLFSEHAPHLLYYSHFPAIIVALTLSTFIIMQNSRSLAAWALAGIAFIYSIWTIADLFIWTQTDSRLIMFLWSYWFFFFASLFALSFYFLYVFIKKRDLPFVGKSLLILLVLPILILSSTTYNLSLFDVYACNALENPFMLTYSYGLALLLFVAIVGLAIREYILAERVLKKQVLLASVGIILFLSSFSVATLYASVMNFFQSSPDTFSLEQYGYFGMTIFIAFLTYTVVQYRAFNVKLIAAQALVVALIILIGSQFFFIRNPINQILNTFAFVLVIGFGYLLIKSVKREIEQRERIEKLAKDLEKANTRLKELDKQKSEFVSIASHQLRSPLTAIRGYASMLAEGSFGALPEKAFESAKRIEESAKLMALSIEDYLNVSRIESGNMKYNLSDFNLKDMASNICDDLRPEALKSNLILLFRSDIRSRGIVNADIGKTNQIIHNLINNSLKYTPKGSVSVFVSDDIKKKRIYVAITDTGIGMSKATVDKLFNKFSRADNANSVNVSGTGLGLFVALKMAEAMGGTITADSEGDGKGSTFTLEMPLAM